MSELKFVEVPDVIIPVQIANNCVHCIVCCNIDYCCFCHKLLFRSLEEYDALSQDQSSIESDSGYCQSESDADNQSITENDSDYITEDELSTDSDTNNSR
jgi:hypothetical protein